MKIGDTLICKKEFSNFICGKTYKISNVNHLTSVEYINVVSNISYSTFSTKEGEFFPYLYDYFFYKKELRKLKLNSL